MNDAEALFKRHSVTELKSILHKIKADAERKKHDLREMVGARYRDVIGAADAIQLMRDSSYKMAALFEDTSTACDINTLKADMLRRTTDTDKDKQEAKKHSLFCVAAQIRLLVITPEQIWNALENKRFLDAARLYVIARLVFHGLNSRSNSVNKSFPVVQRQWDAVSPFRAQIAEKAIASLQSNDLDVNSLLETLGAVAMLEHYSPMELLSTYLAQRVAHLITELDSGSPGNSEPISACLTRAVQIVCETLKSLYGVFLSHSKDKQPLLESLLRSLQGTSNDSTSPTESSSKRRLISNLYSESANIQLIFRYLPESVQDFTPVVNLDKSKLTNGAVQKATRDWLAEIAKILNSKGTILLQSVSSGATLAEIRSIIVFFIDSVEFPQDSSQNQFITVDKPPNNGWKKMVASLLPETPSFSIWTHLFRTVCLNRSKEIVVKAFEPLTLQSSNLLKTVLVRVAQGSQEDRNVASFVWNVSGGGDSTDNHVVYENIQDVCRMQTPAMKELGSAFEKAAMCVLGDVLPLISAPASQKSESPRSSMLKRRNSVVIGSGTLMEELRIGSFDLTSDSESLTSTLKQAFLNALKTYRNGMQDQLKKIQQSINEDDLSAYVLGIDQCLFIGRTARLIALMIAKLEPHFTIVFEASSPASSVSHDRQYIPVESAAQKVLASHGSNSEGAKLSPEQNLLMEVYTEAHMLWISSIGKRLEGNLMKRLEGEDWEHGERFQALWEAVSVSAQGEKGDVLEGKISLPVNASSFVINILFDVCSELNRIGGYTLERPCLTLLLVELSRRIINIYTTFIKKDLPTKRVSEKGAFQLLFDFRLMVKIMEGSWSGLTNSKGEQDAREKDAASLIKAIKQKIDPIDLAIVDAHISSNVERFYSRTSYLLGPLLLLNAKPQDAKRNPSVNEQYNLVSLAPPSQRFNLLPLTGSIMTSKSFMSSRRSLVEEVEGQKPAVDASTSSMRQEALKTKPKATIHLSKSATSQPRTSGVVAPGQSQGSGSSGGRVLGLVSAVAGNISLSSSQQQKATELFMNASSFITGVWGSAPSSNIK